RSHHAHDVAHLLHRVVHEQRHHVDQRRQCVAHHARLLDVYAARTVAGEHEADRVGPQFAGQAHVAGPGHAAELDPGAEQCPSHLDGNHDHTSLSSPSTMLTISGSPHLFGYSGPTNTSPSGGAVGPASVRSRPASSSAGQSSGALPRPTGNRLPTMLRTMW